MNEEPTSRKAYYLQWAGLAAIIAAILLIFEFAN